MQTSDSEYSGADTPRSGAPHETATPVQPAAAVSTSAHTRRRERPALAVSWVLLCIGVVALWFSQGSLNAYWQQTYHRPSPLEPLGKAAWFNGGANVGARAHQFYQSLLDQWPQHSARWDAYREQNGMTDPAVPLSVADAEPVTAPAPASQPLLNITAAAGAPAAPPDLADTNKIVLHPGDKVFFAGDSLMQGVAPHVQQALKKNYNIDSVNLSKQSTGLAYPSFFDWPATIEKTLKQRPEIRVLVVFLGPNDPWDFPDPAHPGAPYLRFKSPEWESVYRQRIGRIVAAAQARQVRIIWLGIPYMQPNKLNQQMRYLNTVLESELRDKALVLPTDMLLSNGKARYVDSIPLNGKNTRMRSSDGIHFSIDGQRLLANLVLRNLDYAEVAAKPESANLTSNKTP